MKKILSLFIMAIILSGCADGDRYNFFGSSENWEALYVVDVSGGTHQVVEGSVKYKGEGEVPDTINYKVDTKPGNSEGIGIGVTDGVANIGGGACSGCAIVQEDQEIEVEITWYGQTDNLILTTDK